ncbi:Xaa-Pro peptidase family protein [Amycolatopsis sp. GM8]|uniref:M24 family metallopeptidase n=1 Tax=Amycolatopsis sp. GM8 TaxID=2896530 RepID=UPI001F2ACC42|nr:Xaa-Pro peptidase family protein [Amycolatopsis sp. GM8]
MTTIVMLASHTNTGDTMPTDILVTRVHDGEQTDVTWTPDRLDRAREQMAELGVDGLLVTPGSDLVYTAGYHIPALSRLTCFVIPSQGEPALVVPSLEEAEAANSAAGRSGVTIRTWHETGDPAALAISALPESAERVALSGRTWFDHAIALQRAFGRGEFLSAGPILGPLRMRKTSAEVDALRDASHAMDRVHDALAAGEVPVIGRTEREIYRDLRELMLAVGHLEAGGNVASGPNSASPHHAPGARRVGEKDVLVVDLAGPTDSGYFSDCARTYCVGDVPDDEFARYYRIVDEANAAAFASVSAGVPAGEVDRMARDVITAAGYGPAFGHRTGHGIGLDVHESPFMRAGNEQTLEPGMCFSIEPGIYLPGRHGARIEDIVTVTGNGAERFNRATHDLVVLTA